MPNAVTQAPYRPVPLDPPRKHWTRAEYRALDGTGVLDQQNLELVEGELITKMGKNRPHVNVVTFVMAWLIRVFGEQFINVEAPIDVAPEDIPTNEPVPDLIVLNRRSREFQSSNPRSADLRLVVEVSGSTLGFDLTQKAALYARAEIAEYWGIDLQEHRLIVHRGPQGGRYQSITVYSELESVAPVAAPEQLLRIGDAFFT